MGKFLGLVAICFGLIFSSPLLAKKGIGGHQIMPVEFYGQASSATLAAALVFDVIGLKADSVCVVTVKSLGTSVNYIKKAVVTADTITVTVDTAQSGSATVINYVCFAP